MAFPLIFPDHRRRCTRTRRTLEKLSTAEIREQCGLPPWAVKEIIELYEPISGQISTSIPLETKVLVFLSQLRSGSFQWVLGRGCGISQSSASRIIEACCNHTLSFASSVIDFPPDTHTRNQIKQGFFDIGRIPNILGVVDGTHVPILAPHDNEPAYINRKQYHSVNCQVVAAHDYRILDIVAKWPGSTHDSFIWANSSVKRRFYDGEFGNSLLLGKQKLQKPIEVVLTP